MKGVIAEWLGLGGGESYPDSSDFPLLLIFAFIFPSIRFVLDRYIFERAGRRFIYKNAAPLMHGMAAADKAALEKTLIKFKESCWKSLYYLSAEVFAIVITYSEPWLIDPTFFFKGPGDQIWPNLMIRPKLKIFYGYVGGFYTYSIFALVFWETRRKDFGVSMSHHVATVVLIVASYLTRFARICSLVVAIHDASDVLLELAKLSKYIDFDIGANIFFALFALSWLLLRILYFPGYIIKSTSIDVLKVLDIHRDMWIAPYLYYSFNFLLILLFYLHIYWWILTVRVLKKVLHSPVTDVRSDEEDDD